MIRKRILAVLLTPILAAALAACSASPAASDSAESSAHAASAASADPSPDPSPEESSEESSAEESAHGSSGTVPDGTPAGASAEESASEAENEQNTNVLVVYYSASGNTARIAQYITEAINADTFVVAPAEPYTDADLDWTDENSRSSREHDDESLRNVELESTTVDGWDNYDTVFIGYPIWWGIAAWPIDGFVSANDFTGKTVVPFCTSSSSGIGESAVLLSELADTGNWLEGERFSPSAGADDVASWVESLGISA